MGEEVATGSWTLRYSGGPLDGRVSPSAIWLSEHLVLIDDEDPAFRGWHVYRPLENGSLTTAEMIYCGERWGPHPG